MEDCFGTRNEAAGIRGMRIQISSEAAQGVFFPAQANQGEANVRGANVGIEVRVDGLDLVQRFLVFASEEVCLSNPVMCSVVGRVEGDGARKVLHSFLQQADMDVNQSPIMECLSQVGVERQRMGKVIDSIGMGEMVRGRPLEPATSQIAGGQLAAAA